MHAPGENAHEQAVAFRETALQNPAYPPGSISQPAC